MEKQEGPSPNLTQAPTGQGRPATFGEALVGINFNPSGDAVVHRAKAICAELADIIHDRFDGVPVTPLTEHLYAHTVGEILNAQMNVVKLLTLK